MQSIKLLFNNITGSSNSFISLRFTVNLTFPLQICHMLARKEIHFFLKIGMIAVTSQAIDLDAKSLMHEQLHNRALNASCLVVHPFKQFVKATNKNKLLIYNIQCAIITLLQNLVILDIIFSICTRKMLHFTDH